VTSAGAWATVDPRMLRSPPRAASARSPRRDRAAALVLVLASQGCGDQIVGTFDPSRGEGEAGMLTITDGSTAGSVTIASAEGTDAPMGPELCDGLDNDRDGLVDEVAPGLTECDGCRLLQGAGQAWWVCDSLLTWDETRARCEGLGATTAIVASAEAQAFVVEAVGQGWYWLGARQAADEGGWSWIDGTPWEYTSWGTIQPDDTAPGQDCLRLTFGIVGEGWFEGAWDDFFCDDPHPWMCSAPHEP
jgi:hypothetical protein